MRFLIFTLLAVAIGIIITDPSGRTRPSYKACVNAAGNGWEHCQR